MLAPGVPVGFDERSGDYTIRNDTTCHHEWTMKMCDNVTCCGFFTVIFDAKLEIF